MALVKVEKYKRMEKEMAVQETTTVHNETSTSPNAEAQEGKVPRKVLPVICGVVFTVLGIMCWALSLRTVESYLSLKAGDSYSISLMAVVFVSAGISCLLVASFGADAAVTIKGKTLGDTGIRLGSFFAIWALAGGSLFVVMGQVHDRRNELILAVEEEREAHMPYRHFMQWLSTEEKDNMGIRVAANLAKHVTDESDPVPITITVVRKGEDTDWMVENGGDHNQVDGKRATLFGLKKGTVNLELWDENRKRRFGTMQAHLKRDLQLNLGFVVNENDLCSAAFAERIAIVSNLKGAKEHVHKREFSQAVDMIDKAMSVAWNSSMRTSRGENTRSELADEDK